MVAPKLFGQLFPIEILPFSFSSMAAYVQKRWEKSFRCFSIDPSYDIKNRHCPTF